MLTKMRPPALDVFGVPSEDEEQMAVQVVRCKDCVRRSEYGFCYKHGHSVTDDFFCAYGTREETRTEKKREKAVKEICASTGLPCSRCMPGPCDRRRETDDKNETARA